MLNKMTIKGTEFDFEKLLEETKRESISFEFTAQDKKDAIETIKTMGRIIQALFCKLNEYNEYTEELEEDNKRLYEENYDYFKTLIGIKNTVNKLSNSVASLDDDIHKSIQFFTKDEENEENEEEW